LFSGRVEDQSFLAVTFRNRKFLKPKVRSPYTPYLLYSDIDCPPVRLPVLVDTFQNSGMIRSLPPTLTWSALWILRLCPRVRSAEKSSVISLLKLIRKSELKRSEEFIWSAVTAP